MASTYRDRTSEFRSLSDTLQKIGGITAVNQSQNAQSPSRPSWPASSGSEFNKKASRIGLGIHETTQKISKLAQCNWNSPLFSISDIKFPCFIYVFGFMSLFLARWWLRKCWIVTILKFEFKVFNYFYLGILRNPAEFRFKQMKNLGF
jgi:hypothetical protein